MTKILIIDNYDSFVYNIAQYLGELGAEVRVERNDSPNLNAIINDFDGYVISPGPGHPRTAGKSLDVIADEGFGKPVLGVCLGHQAIAHVRGGSVVRAANVMHGKLSTITHKGDPLFSGVPERFSATRYHSLLVSREKFPSDIEVLAQTDANEIMALKVRDKPIYGVQFHPESVMTANGRTILSNFLRMCSK